MRVLHVIDVASLSDVKIHINSYERMQAVKYFNSLIQNIILSDIKGFESLILYLCGINRPNLYNDY